MSYIDRPDFDDDGLLELWGYVRRIKIEQENSRDQIWFRLEIFVEWGGDVVTYDETFTMYLDQGTTVALAQLQLLRDAMQNEWLTYIHYYNDPDSSNNYVYLVQIYEDKAYPTTLNELFS